MFSLKEKLKSFGEGMLGMFIMVGVTIIGMLIIFGAAKIIGWVYPIISFVAGIVLFTFILLVLPFSFFHKLRPFLSATSLIFSYIYEVAVWMLCFLIVVYGMGFWGLFFLLFFKVIVPVAIIGLLIKGYWQFSLMIIVSYIIAFGMRFFGIWLMGKYEKRMERYEILDVDSKLIEME